jgi:hypothetical protein
MISRHYRHRRSSLARPAALLAVGAVGAIVTTGCTAAKTTTVEVDHKVSIPSSANSSTTEPTTSTSGSTNPDGARLLPVGALDFSELELNVACDGPPQLVELNAGSAAAGDLTVSLRGDPVFGDINGDGVDDAVVVLSCARGLARTAEAVTAVLSAQGDGRATVPVPIGPVAADEYAFPGHPDGTGSLTVQFATMSAEEASAAFPPAEPNSEETDTSEGSDDTIEEDPDDEDSSGKDSGDEGSSEETGGTDNPTTTTLPEGATPSRTVKFTVTEEGASLAEETAADGSSQPSVELSAKGLGSWTLGAERDTVVADLLKVDPSATQSTDLPDCLANLADLDGAESVRSGALTLGFAEGTLQGVWIDLTFGAAPPVPIAIGGELLNAANADTILAKFPGSMVTTEADGTRLISLTPNPRGMWLVADAEGYPVGAGLADQPCAVTG